jgi:methylated-DNA-[protein]-cysteine S-methyltransferase
MTTHGFTLFDTAIGRCAIAWSRSGIVALQLPERRDSETRSRLLEQCPEACAGEPPAPVQQAIESVVALLGGEARDLSAVPLDMTRVSPFHRRVYQAARGIPPGSTLSYGDIAARLGTPGAARAVGQALGRNPFAIVVPCHRVLAAGGKLGGFSANGGATTKIRLLSIERMSGGPAEDGESGLRFDPARAAAHLRSADPVLARTMDVVGPMRLELEHTASIFTALAQAIVYQQLTGKAAATIFARVRALFPSGHLGLTADQILRVSNAKLRAAGLSNSKMLSLRDLAQKSSQGSLPTLAEIAAMDDEAIVERLTIVRGIGRWTVEMLLIFRLGRPDVLPVDDYGIRKGFAAAFRKRALPGPSDVARHGERWRPYRSVASWYLWRAADLASSTRRP